MGLSSKLQTKLFPKIEILAVKFSLLIFISACITAVASIFATDLSSAQIGVAAGVATLNCLSWVAITLGLFTQNNLKILYFLVGVSFKTLVILLVVQQLKTGPAGYLYFQILILNAALFLLLILVCIFRKWLFEKNSAT